MKVAWPLCALALLSTGCGGSPPSEAATASATAGAPAVPDQAGGSKGNGADGFHGVSFASDPRTAGADR